MTPQSSSGRIYWFLGLLTLALMITACDGRIDSQWNTVLPTQAPEAELPAKSNSLLTSATFTPLALPAAIDVEAGVEMETAVDSTSPPTATNTAVSLPTQEPAPALSVETRNLLDELDDLLNQIDQMNNDDLSDLP